MLLLCPYGRVQEDTEFYLPKEDQTSVYINNAVDEVDALKGGVNGEEGGRK